MKKTISKLFAILCVIVMTISVVPINCLAAGSSAISCNTSVNIGDSVAVRVSITAGAESSEIIAVSGNLNFDSSILSFTGSDVTTNASGSSILFSATSTSGSRTMSITFNFTAISAGTSGISLANTTYADAVSDSPISVAGQSVNINVAAPEAVPSEPTSSAVTNSANLSSLRVSGATLSPRFAVGRTSYTATVGYSIDKVTISATPADSKAKVSGTGSVKLEVGENKKNITVTATDGATKTYTVTIKRMTEEETAAAENPEEAVNPLAVTIGEANYTIVQDISALVIPDGYTVGSETVGESTAVNVLKDAKEKYTLYYITDESGNDTALYTKNSDGEYERLSYMLLGSKLYIFEEVDENLSAPEGWFVTEYAMTNGSVKAYQSQNPSLADFYWFYVYTNGENGFYRYDNAEGVMQRAPDFELVEARNASADANGKKGIMARISSMSLYGKIIIVLIALAIICIISLVVLLIVKMMRDDDFENPSLFDASPEDEFDFVGKDDAILNAFANTPEEEKTEPVKEEKVINFEDFDDDI